MSLSLTAAEIASLRATADSYLPDTCTIQRAVIGPDSGGGISESWSDLATNVHCRLDVRDRVIYGSAETEIDGALAIALDYTLYLTYTQDITSKDRVVIAGSTFEVMGVAGEQTWLTCKRCKLGRLK